MAVAAYKNEKHRHVTLQRFVLLFESKRNDETMQIVNGLVHIEALCSNSCRWPTDIWKGMASNVAVTAGSPSVI